MHPTTTITSPRGVRRYRQRRWLVLELKQKALHKEGRCYASVRPVRVFLDEIDGMNRRDFAVAAAAKFEEAARVWPSGPLADDALTESAWHRRTLLGDPLGSYRLLNEVVSIRRA